MKQLFSCFALLASLASSANNYYFSIISGNDTRTTTQAQSQSTPWQTISKLNTILPSLANGDSVLFKAGETWNGGTIAMGGHGSINYGSYGTGAKPVINAYINLTGTFLAAGGNVWYATLDVPLLQLVNINGKLAAMGRYPNSGYIQYTSHGTTVVNNNTVNTSITGPGVSGIPFNPAGGVALIRKYRFYLDGQRIVSRSGNTLNLDYASWGWGNPSGGAQDLNGAFIQDHLSTLDIDDEWYYDKTAKRLYIYSSVPINTKTIKAGGAQIAINANNSNNISITNMKITGYNDKGIEFNNANIIKVSNCDFIEIGGDAIAGSGGAGNDSIINNKIRSTLSGGIVMERSNEVIRGNDIDSVGLIIGLSRSGDAQGNGIHFQGQNIRIEFNSVQHVAYNGISSYVGNNWIVYRNFVNYTNLVKDDGGGIYQYGIDTVWKSNRIVRGNIVLNSIGNYDGGLGAYQPGNLAFGIYMDNYSDHVTIDSNLVIGSASGAFHNSSFCHDNNYLDNTAFDYDYGMLFLDLQQGFGSTTRNLNIQRNSFISKLSTQPAYYFETYAGKNAIAGFGTLNNNNLSMPLNPDGNFVKISDRTGGVNNNTFYTLTQWRATYGKEINSTRSLATLTDANQFRVDYNKTNNPVNLTLPATYTTIINNSSPYSSIALPPYSGRVSLFYSSSVFGSGSGKTWINPNTGKAYKQSSGKAFKTP